MFMSFDELAAHSSEVVSHDVPAVSSLSRMTLNNPLIELSQVHVKGR